MPETKIYNLYDIVSGTVAGSQCRYEDGQKRTKANSKTGNTVFCTLADKEPLPILLENAKTIFLSEGHSDMKCLETIVHLSGLEQTLVLGAHSANSIPSIAQLLNQLASPKTKIVFFPDLDTPGIVNVVKGYHVCDKLTPLVITLGEEEGDDVRGVWEKATKEDQKQYASWIREHVEDGIETIFHTTATSPGASLVLQQLSELIFREAERKLKRSPVKLNEYWEHRTEVIPPVVLGAFGVRSGLLCSIVGPPSAGKSALALAGALSVAYTPNNQEGSFANESVLGGDVLWIAAEGEHSLPSRVSAWQEKHQPKDFDYSVWPKRFGVITAYDSRRFGPGNIVSQEDDLNNILGAWCEENEFYPKLIVLDTLAQSLAASGLDENSHSGMNSVIGWGHSIIEALTFDAEQGPSVMIVHHTGKDTDRGARGHSTYHGALDVEVHVRNNSLYDSAQYANIAKTFFAKNRYGERTGITSFQLEPGGHVDPDTGAPMGVRAVWLDI